MSVQERPRDRDKEKQEKEAKKKPKIASESQDEAESWLDTYPTQTKVKEKEKTEPQSTRVEVESLLEQFTASLPTWVQKPWMYVKPTHEGHLNSWYESWKSLILSYSKILVIHIINLYDLQNQHPFSNKTNGKNLSLEELEYIIEQMVDENLAKWLEKSTLARIYYKSDKQWSEEIYTFSLEYGYAAEVMTLYELKKLKQDWSELPITELREILNILVDENKAEWIDLEKDSIKFRI